MDQGRGVQHHIAWLDIDEVGQDVDRHRRPAGLGVPGGLKAAGGAGGVQRQDHIVRLGFAVDGLLRSRRRQRQKVRRAVRPPKAEERQAGQDDGRVLAARSVRSTPWISTRRVRAGQHLGLFARGEPRIEWNPRSGGLWRRRSLPGWCAGLLLARSPIGAPTGASPVSISAAAIWFDRRSTSVNDRVSVAETERGPVAEAHRATPDQFIDQHAHAPTAPNSISTRVLDRQA